MVIHSSVGRFVGTIGLNLPEKQEVPQSTNCSEALETPIDEGFVRGRRDRWVREIDDIKGVGAVQADLILDVKDGG